LKEGEIELMEGRQEEMNYWGEGCEAWGKYERRID
jgi:hypothetical protein